MLSIWIDLSIYILSLPLIFFMKRSSWRCLASNKAEYCLNSLRLQCLFPHIWIQLHHCNRWNQEITNAGVKKATDETKGIHQKLLIWCQHQTSNITCERAKEPAHEQKLNYTNNVENMNNQFSLQLCLIGLQQQLCLSSQVLIGLSIIKLSSS